MENRAENYVIVGRVAGVFGVRGWLKIESYTEPRMNIFDYRPWRLSEPAGPLDIGEIQGKRQGKGLIAQLNGIDDRDVTEAWVGSQISVKRSQLPESAEGEFYWVDLVGLEVVTRQGKKLGRVDYLMATGANDVLVVAGDRQRLIPFVNNQVIKVVDLKNGVITVDWDPEF